MKSEALRRFLQAVAEDQALQARCAAAGNLADLLNLAQAAGYGLTARELQLWAHDEAFDAPWWPWAAGDGAAGDGAAGDGAAARRAFFRGAS